MAETVIAPSGGGAGGTGAPTTADYLVRTADAGLSAERVVTDTATVVWDWTTPGQAKATAITGGTGDVVGPAGAIDGEVVLYSGVTGKLIKRATGTGITRALAGVYVTPSELSGDVVTSGSNAVTIAANAVTYAKMQDISAASRLLGRGSAAGAGDPEEILLGTNLSMSGTTLNATAGGSSDTVVIVAADVVHAANSTTLSDITGLVFSTTGGANELWFVEVLLITSTNASGSTAADYKIGWTVSGAQTGLWGGNPETGGGTASTTFAGLLSATLAYGSMSSALGQGLIHLRALIRANGASGAIQLQFAQQALVTGGLITIKADSLLIARKVRS